MRRVAIIGSAGAGKSTLAKQLGQLTGIEVIHLDSYYWRPGWVEPPRAEWEAFQKELVDRDAWIMDGNYGRTMDVRLQVADTVIFLDLPRTVCVYRALKRRLQYAGKTRPDMAEGCPEKIDMAFIQWIWNFPKNRRDTILQRLHALPEDRTVIHLQSRKAVSRFLKSLEDANHSRV